MRIRPLPALVFAALMFARRDARAAEPATTTVSPLVGAHMVLARGRPAPIAGGDEPGQAVRVTFAGQTVAAKADAAGRWRVTLPALLAGGPFTLTVEGSRTLRFDDIWIGDVWLASGQSNMALPLSRSTAVDQAVAAGCAGLSFFVVDQTLAVTPQGEPHGRWARCDAELAPELSAVAFHFGRDLHRALGVPVGLIVAAWGGTPAEAWTPRAALAADSLLKPMVDAFDAARDPARREEAARALAAWEAKNFHADTGNRGEALGFAKGAGHGWAKMAIPQLWENAGLQIDGAVWFRREVEVPAEWAGQDLALSLGALDDFDTSYWNGTRVGATGPETPEYYAAPRHYVVPGALVKAGRNLIAVRVFDHYGNGGFVGPRPALTVGPASGDTRLPLAGTWEYKIERRLPPAVADWASRPRSFAADDPQSPTVLWNAMIAPLAAVPVSGVIWYQGESNVGHAAVYRRLFPALIRSWREAFHDPTLPFLYVQLPNFDDPVVKSPLGEGAWADLREAQAMALREPATAMAVTLDIGEGNNLHPHNKQEVGRRLALAALKLVYHRDVIAGGPLFRAADRDGTAVRLHFTIQASGLETADGAAPRGFVVAGADHVWHPAVARIDRETVVVSSPDVPAPLAVRYGWGNDPPNTLRNQADLPAAPFRTDDWGPASAPVAGSK
ncbi:MAG TPA: sialate O-acetylesterase [Polyangia bacterium]|nr:sialate O-acetylesterase [Polyangia bacterium]